MADRAVNFSDEASIDFHRAKCYMEFNGKEDEFWQDVDKQVNLIREFPLAFQIRYKNVSIIPLQRFNYTIHYIVKSNHILVYRFLNQNQYY